ncbi:MAG: hypothetical protein ACJ74W_01050 [Pyrinomonadaceae bacterium]
MTTHLKPLEELLRELPPERQAEVRSFVESLLANDQSLVSSSGQNEINGRNFEQYFGAWDSEDENSADNERIDADLAREYGTTHESDN